MKRKLLWWITFIIATVALSEVFRFSRLLTSESAQANPWMLILWLGILAFSFLVLSYDSYIKAKQEGKVAHQIRLFEKWYQLRHKEKSQ